MHFYMILVCLFFACTPVLDTASAKPATKSLRNPPGCIILKIGVFDKSMLIDELFEKALQSFPTSLSVRIVYIQY